MKKYFFIIGLFWFNTFLVIAQSPNFRIYDTNNDILGPVTEMPTNAIADDFGPRDLDDGFHAGVDFNCYQGAGESQRWWMIVSPQVGRIADFDRLTHGSSVYKYGLVNSYDSESNGSHTWLFGHVFDKSSQFYDKFDHSIVLKRCEDSDIDKWGLLLDLGDGIQYAYGQIAGATLKVNNQTYTTIDVINTVNPFLPLGNSGGPNTNYPVHLHLNTLPFNTSVQSDAINGDPCQFLDIDRPSYDVTVNSQFNSNNISLNYPGTSPTKIKARVQMHGEPVNVNRYSKLMDADKVELLLKKDIESEFKRIRGDKMTAIVSEGGKLGEAVINHSNPVNKTNWMSQGVNSNAYNSATSGANARNPWDDYYFIDFPTRIHKNDQLNSGTLFSDTPENARYNDGKYDFKVRTTSPSGGYEDDAEKELKVDNFWPYIKEIKLYDAYSSVLLTSLKRNSFEGTSSENDGYIKNAWIIPALWPFVEGHRNIKIEVTTSEPMQYMKTKHAPISTWQNMTPIQNDPQKWVGILEYFILLPYGCHLDFEFDGKDLNNNKLLDVYHLSNENGDVPVDIPTRKASNGNILDWNNFPSSTLYDRVKLCVNDCESGGLIPRSEIISGCDAISNLDIIIKDISCGASGSIEFTNLDLEMYNYIIQWYDLEGNIIEEFNGLTEIILSHPGIYCYKIEYKDGCCSVSDCIEIKELVFSHDDILYSFEDDVNEPGNKNLKLTVMNVPEIYNYDITLKLTDEIGNVITKSITHDDEKFVVFENLVPGKTYCLHIESGDGYCYDNCFTVEGNPCSLTVEAEVTNAACPEFNDGAINVNISSAPVGCQSFSYNWSNGAVSSNINNLSPGIYCVTVTTDKSCNGCLAVKCFEVLEGGSQTDPISVNAVTRINCVEEYNETTGNYTIKWFGFVDMIVSGGTGNYTFKWYPQPVNSSSNQNGEVNSYRFQFDQNGPYCVEITDDCGNIYQNCFDDAPIARKSTDGISLEATEKFGCLSVDGPKAEGFYSTFGFSDPKFNIVDLMSLLTQRNYPASLAYSPDLIFVKDHFTADSVSYNMFVDNFFIMGNVGMSLRSGLRDVSAVENNNPEVIAKDNGLILQAFPNPFSDLLNISVFSKENINGVLEVYDIMGQKIYSDNITVSKDNTISRSLPLNSISSGIYTISLLTDESYQNIKVVKVK